MKSIAYKSLLFISIIIGKSVSAQRNVDSFVNTLHNTNAKSAVAWVAPKRRPDSTKIYGSSIERILTNVHIGEIKRVYPKYVLIRKLVECLNDSERDWYADLLLYSLTDSSSLNIIPCSTRDQWLKVPHDMNVTHKAIDVEMWHKYLVGLSPSEKW